ncbi:MULTISPECIES: hypothetical protein [Chryseobacterium]|jgi:hypothetical protein|uniref:Uncharacterized protein n=1 Tax=Chryseobacterium rhizosphaerae TaxID=395937 RepID=A0AAE3YE59_9FLAO|nr:MULTISPECIES: hypothetical protein [Chryseobacterium]MBL3546641.1 hypothetical protein [Chryseobacterium sp. KMC2]MDR6528689.1 hypothetical protein [Chryseobacterium rhizosphaerae]SMC98938.1 hypothetical protein SAMN02787074_4250 [Chryseobacterium sp. YR221]
MKEEQEKIKEKIQNWMAENKSQLSLNSDTWNIDVFENKKNTEFQKSLKLGKYNAELTESDPFYKPYSKMHIL